jgi:DNA modification methylase
VKLKVTEIKNNPNNPRLIKDDAFKKLVQSIKEFPEMLDAREIVVNKDYVILGGNMRFKAAKEAGLKEVPVKVVDWSEDKQREFIIKDNVSGGEWDWDLLANEWDTEELDAWGLELPASLDIDADVEEDEAPEVDEKGAALSIPGTIYQLGRHRVMCGSATNEEDTNTLLGEQKIDLYLTDPPYNVDYTGKTKDALKIENDKMDDGEFLAFLADSHRRADEHMKNGAAFYIFHADSEGYNFRAAVKEVGWMLKQCLIWVKQTMVMGRQDYQWKHEPILYGWKAGASHSWYTDRKQTTVLEFDRPQRNAEHPTMKPLNILAYLIQNSTKAGDLVFDNFLGSGSTLMAAEQTDRTCYGMELDPKYVDVIRKRYAKHTNGGELPEDWAELTKEINNEEDKTTKKTSQ